MEQSQTPTMGVTINKKVNNNRTTAIERTAALATEGSLNAMEASF